MTGKLVLYLLMLALLFLGYKLGVRFRLLVNKMMMDNHVNLVGEGLVGPATFTRNYNWILSQKYARESHPPEVLNEMRQQISAGMETAAVIPVLPHGVVQLGSSSAIMENMGFVNDVKTLVLQRGCDPGALFTENYETKEPDPKLGASICLGKSASMDSFMKSRVKDLTSYITDNYNQQDNSPTSRVDGQSSNFLFRHIQDNLQSLGPTFQNPQCSVNSSGHGQAEVIPDMKPKIGFRRQLENLENGVTEAEIVSSNPELWRNQEATNYDYLRFLEQQMLVDAVVGDHLNNSLNESSVSISSQQRTNEGLVSSSHKGSTSAPSHEPRDLHNVLGGHLLATSNPSSLSGAQRLANNNISSICITESVLQNVARYKTEVSSLSFGKKLTTNYLLSDSSTHKHQITEKKCTQVDLEESKVEVESDMFHAINVPFPLSDDHINLSDHIPGFIHDRQKLEYGYQNMGLSNAQFENAYVQPQSGDDLFDILGANFKNKLFNESWNNILNNGPATNSQSLEKNNYALHNLHNACSELQVVNEENLDSGIFSVTGTDHLLDAVVSRVQSVMKQSSDDNLSCRTTLTRLSSSSGPNAPTSPGQASASSQMQEELFSLSKSLTKAGELSLDSFKSGSCKEDSRYYSQTNSFYGSQISSWVELGADMKRSVSTSTAYSKRPDDISKSNRKRPKPGENPRPRPKDRQMIQDRVKELREIIPNGAKCSIDALLERTIKHMLFLQNVTKHADKLKQTGDSKIISKEGGLLLKNNLEGGATWAYEVGSQSVVCPIIVEDLNPPRQMLVEMLCEEQGLFLEIADLIRGLGLNILKGVMETQNDKIWARFAVEANRDVTRMEIFVSLVHLLEQTVKTSAASTNSIDNDSVMAHQPFRQVASISAAALPVRQAVDESSKFEQVSHCR